MSTIVLLIIIVLLVLYAVSVFNRVVTLRNRQKNTFAQIDVQLQRRHDLIPNLVETAKKYMEHESQTLIQVTQARNEAVSAKRSVTANPSDGGAMGKMGQAEGVLGGALANFRARAEAYPDLKANQTMSDLMEELTSTENRIGFSRQAYNDAVMAFNTYCQKFPNNLVANTLANYQQSHPLKIHDPAIRKSVTVSF